MSTTNYIPPILIELLKIGGSLVMRSEEVWCIFCSTCSHNYKTSFTTKGYPKIPTVTTTTYMWQMSFY